MQLSREITRLTLHDAEHGHIMPESTWHAQYLNDDYIYIKNLDTRLSEGDLITLFSQFGEVIDCKLLRHNITGDSLRNAFIGYENTLSAILAIENMNGVDILGRTLIVDHAKRHVSTASLASSLTSGLSFSKHKKDSNSNAAADDNTTTANNKKSSFIDMKEAVYGDDCEERKRLIWDTTAYYESNEDKLLYESLFRHICQFSPATSDETILKSFMSTSSSTEGSLHNTGVDNEMNAGGVDDFEKTNLQISHERFGDSKRILHKLEQRKRYRDHDHDQGSSSGNRDYDRNDSSRHRGSDRRDSDRDSSSRHRDSDRRDNDRDSSSRQRDSDRDSSSRHRDSDRDSSSRHHDSSSRLRDSDRRDSDRRDSDRRDSNRDSSSRRHDRDRDSSSCHHDSSSRHRDSDRESSSRHRDHDYEQRRDRSDISEQPHKDEATSKRSRNDHDHYNESPSYHSKRRKTEH